YVSEPGPAADSGFAPGGAEASSARADGVPLAVVAGVESLDGAGVGEDAAGAEAGGVSAGRLAGAADTVGGAAALFAYPGGSSRIGYSRWMRPAAHDTSISMSTNGSLIGAMLVILRKGAPLGRFSTEKRSRRSD